MTRDELVNGYLNKLTRPDTIESTNSATHMAAFHALLDGVERIGFR
jgi:hypothetical protein